jgi:hypothetical protein
MKPKEVNIPNRVHLRPSRIFGNEINTSLEEGIEQWV